MYKMKAGVTTFLVLVLYGAVQNCEAGDAWRRLITPTVYQTFPVFKYSDQCAYNGLDVSQDYRRAIYDFMTELYKRVAKGSHLHAVDSPFSIWMTLAAMAEGAEGSAQAELFKVLNLPDDKCQRQKYYQLASKAEVNGPDATLFRTRVFAYDESLKLNQYWKNYINANCLMNTLAVPIKRDPKGAVSFMKDLISTRLPTPLTGNSIILDSLDYQGLWTTAFSDAIIENTPFCNDFGQQIGTVDLMKIKKRVRMAYLPDIKAKALELPVGYNGRYRMIIVTTLGPIQEAVETFKNTIVFDLLHRMQTSRIPIDIAIPRFTMTTEYDARPYLEDMGIHSIWTDAYATKNISHPAAKPSSLLQRVTITFDRAGVFPNTEEHPSSLSDSTSETGLEPVLGRDFIVNRPFMFGLMDSETNTVLWCSVFSSPTTRFELKK